MQLTPGARFLLTTIPQLLLPPLLVHSALLLLNTHVYPIHLSRPLITCIWVFTVPACAYISATYTRFIYAREARKMGAELVPELRGKLPGNIDLIWSNFFRRDLYLADGFGEPMKKLGTTFGMTILGDLRIFTAHPQNIKQMLATDFDSYEKGEKFNKFTGSVLGTGVFNSDGEMWQFHRKITRPYFAKERITDFGIFDAKAHLALDKMQEHLDRGNPIDFQDICSRFTIDSACEFLLGTSINSLADPLPLPGADTSNDSASNRFARAFADAQHSISVRSRLGELWPLPETLKDRTADDMAVIHAFIEPIIRRAMEVREGAGGKAPQEDSLLQHLLNVTDDMKLIIDETVNIMLAGRDTTAGLLTFVTYCMAMHPEVLARLREEILSTVGTSRAPTFDDVRGMRYLRAVLNETLRVFPSVPLNSRHTARATTLVNDAGKKIYVPAKTRVMFAVLLMQRNPDYWGPDAHVFDPDRWLDDRVRKYVTPNPFIFLPFNAGPRICLGQQFAYHEASFFLIRMLQRFDSIRLAQPAAARPPPSWRTRADGAGSARRKIEEFVPKSHLTMYAEGGLWVRMGRAKVLEGV